MPLSLGTSFDRNYNLRIPFLNGFYNIGIYFNKRSTFLLFRIDPEFTKDSSHKSVKINMFKNLESSKFCETFLNLHNYRKSTLDIVNQFESIKPEFSQDISFVLNETVVLSKFDVGDKELFDNLIIYGLTINNYIGEFLFILAERQNIITRLERKLVRTTGIQISTSTSLEALDELHEESKNKGKVEKEPRQVDKKPIKLD
jgi:hypothetical protein